MIHPCTCSEQQARAVHAPAAPSGYRNRPAEIDPHAPLIRPSTTLSVAFAQDRRRNNVEHRTGDGEYKYCAINANLCGAEITHQCFHGSLEVFRLFSRHHLAAGAVSASAFFSRSVKAGLPGRFPILESAIISAPFPVLLHSAVTALSPCILRRTASALHECRSRPCGLHPATTI